MMTTATFSRLAAAIFTVIAILQLGRALLGIPVTAGSMTMPLWPSWTAAVVFATLAWLGFTAGRA
jgi:hypothetical protein